MIAKYFPLIPEDEQKASELANRQVVTIDENNRTCLKRDWRHGIRKDKKGKNPAVMLLQVLYKHLISLIEQNAVLVDERIHKTHTFD